LTHIREFQAEYGEIGPPRVRIRLQARLVLLPRRTSVAATSEAFTVVAEDRSLQAIVAAFDEGLGKALRRVVEWTVREIEKAEATRAASGG
jgi:cholesterol transport system auxiliary component